MSKGLKVLWTENSIQDLESIKEFISQDSITRVEEWVLKFFNIGESLFLLSGRGRIVPEFGQDNLRELLVENDRLVYKINSATVEIISIFEGHRQFRIKNEKK